MVEWVFNVGCSIWWLHVWDWTAVAWATVLAYLIEKAILFGVLVWKEPTQWRNSIPPAPVLWLLSGLVLAFAAARLWL